MTPLRLILAFGMALLAQALPVGSALAEDFFVFPVKVSVTVRDVAAGVVVTRTLKENDFVNLALGRPLGTKVDKKREVLAVVIPRYPDDATEGKLIVVDPSRNGLAQITTDVAVSTAIDRERAVLAKGAQGIGTITGQFQQTVLGDPTKNALHATTAWASGVGKVLPQDKGSTSGIVAGRVSFTATANGRTATVDGFIVKGKAKVPAKPISMFSDGAVTPGCGNGIIEPNLGEDCEFVDQSACPGQCNACRCVVCGNNRIDPGEICDGTDEGVCPLLDAKCKTSCTGCEVCGDGVVGNGEACDPGAPNQCPGSACLPDTCTCGCTPGVPETCPGTTCCNPTTHRCCEPGKPGCGLSYQACCGGPQTLPNGLCGGLVAPGAECPDRPTNGCFICSECDGKFITGTCTAGFDSVCTFDPP